MCVIPSESLKYPISYKIQRLMSKSTPKKQDKEDDSTLRLMYAYRKRCDNFGIAVSPCIKGIFEVVTEAGKNPTAKLELLHCNEQIGPMQIRALMQVASQLQYPHLKLLRIWKAGIGDQGLRMICRYLATTYSLELVDVLQNEITPLGCQFLGKAMNSNVCRIKHLKLDDNLILTQGLKHLTLGLRTNNALDKLSLKYCGIDREGARYIQEILANIGSKLRSLKLQGNLLGNESVFQILRAAQYSDSLQKINLADTGMHLLDYQAERESIVEALAHQLVLLMGKNKNIIKYDIRFNPMHNEIAEQLLKSIELNPNIKKMEFANNVSYDLRDALDTIVRKRNKGKKGGKPKKVESSPKKK